MSSRRPRGVSLGIMGFIRSQPAGIVQHDLCHDRTAAIYLKDDGIASEVFEYEFLPARN